MVKIKDTRTLKDKVLKVADDVLNIWYSFGPFSMKLLKTIR